MTVCISPPFQFSRGKGGLLIRKTQGRAKYLAMYLAPFAGRMVGSLGLGKWFYFAVFSLQHKHGAGSLTDGTPILDLLVRPLDPDAPFSSDATGSSLRPVVMF